MVMLNTVNVDVKVSVESKRAGETRQDISRSEAEEMPISVMPILFH